MMMMMMMMMMMGGGGVSSEISIPIHHITENLYMSNNICIHIHKCIYNLCPPSPTDEIPELLI